MPVFSCKSRENRAKYCHLSQNPVVLRYGKLKSRSFTGMEKAEIKAVGDYLKDSENKLCELNFQMLPITAGQK